MDAKFYNKMPFPIPLRKTWEVGAPKLVLGPGEVLMGPADLLSQFQFLAQVPFDYSRVESMTQNSNFEFKDKLLDEYSNKNKQNVNDNIEVEVEEVEITPKQAELAEKVFESIEKKEEKKITGMDFDPKTVNWVSVKVDQLERACKFLKINTDFLSDKKPKEKKWELVKLVKSHYKM